MPSSESPQDDFLDIRLSGSPYQLYSPGSKVNGSVIFNGSVEDAIIEIEFIGTNKTRIIDQKDEFTSQPVLYVDEAVPFPV